MKENVNAKTENALAVRAQNIVKVLKKKQLAFVKTKKNVNVKKENAPATNALSIPKQKKFKNITLLIVLLKLPDLLQNLFQQLYPYS